MSLDGLNAAVIARRERMARDRRQTLLAALAVLAVFAFVGAIVLGGFTK